MDDIEYTKLQDDEIVAAMECCYSNDSVRLCGECPLSYMRSNRCKELLGRNALDLIYHLRGED